MTAKNKMAYRSPGVKYLGLSLRPQGRYIVTHWFPRSMAWAPLSGLGTFKDVPDPSWDRGPHDVEQKWCPGPPD